MTTNYEPLAPSSAQCEKIMLARQTSLPEFVCHDDPASGVMIDLTRQHIKTVNVDDRFSHIEQEMAVGDVNLLLVRRDNALAGIIESKDLYGIKLTQIASLDKSERQDIPAERLMTPTDQAIILNYQDVMHARVGNVFACFKQHKKTYALILDEPHSTKQPELEGIEQTDGDCFLRGLITAAKLCSQLGTDLNELALA